MSHGCNHLPGGSRCGRHGAAVVLRPALMATTTIVGEQSLHGPSVQPHLPGHYLSWGAIIAGALCAAAISLVLFAFGSAIGLSAVSPWPHVGLSPTVALIIVALWTAIVQVVGFA